MTFDEIDRLIAQAGAWPEPVAFLCQGYAYTSKDLPVHCSLPHTMLYTAEQMRGYARMVAQHCAMEDAV